MYRIFMGDGLEMSSNNAVNGIALNADKLCLNNGDIDRCMSGDLRILKDMDDGGGRSDTDAGENERPVPPPIIAHPSDGQREDYSNLEVKHHVNDETSCNTDCANDAPQSVINEIQPNTVSDNGFEDCETSERFLDQASDLDFLMTTGNNCSEIEDSADDGDGDGRSDTDAGENETPVPPPDAASSHSADDEHTGYLNLEVENSVNDETRSNIDDGNDPPQSVIDEPQTNLSDIEDGEANKHCLDQASDLDLLMTADSSCSEVQNSAADGGNSESRSTVQNDDSSPQKSASCVALDTGSVSSDFESSKPEDLLAGKSDKNHDADKSRAVDAELQLKCEADEVQSVSASTENEKPGDASASAADGQSTNSSLSTSQVSTVNVYISTATSLSTVAKVVISTPSSSSSPSKAVVLTVPSSTTVTRSQRQRQRQRDKSVTIPVPAASVHGSGTTRQMSKVLQDVGLLLVSQRVFRNLAAIQKQKIGDSQKKCDVQLLQKLKTSHQNLVAKNHTLLMASWKCGCGYRSESLNVIEAHRLQCNFLGRCCYCRGEFVYRTQKQMQRHLWKVHKKVGHMIEGTGSYSCAFCPLNFSSRWILTRHMDDCRRKFLLASNLAPKENDKDIPITAASRQIVQIPVRPLASSAQISPAAATRNLSGGTRVSSAPVVSPAVVPPAHRNPAPVPQLLQIGKHLFTVLPSTAVTAPAITVSQSSAVKVVGKVAPNSAVQTAQKVNSALPVVPVVGSRSSNQAASHAVTVPTPVLPYSVCSVCSAFVKDKTALLVHMHIAHSSTHKMCQYCCSPYITFSSLTELHLHIAKFHTSDCWICKTRFQPPEQLINHVAHRHKVTMSKMLELRRCYLCSSVPAFRNYTAFEEHMMKSHSLQFADTGKLWDHIVTSPNADKDWYAKRNPDGTLECPSCLGQFISASFLYRHIHLEHDGSVIRLVHCRECGKQLPSNILFVHLIASHTRKCSVPLCRVDVPDHGRVFIPPVGTKRIKNKKGERISSSPPLKRIKAVETVVISDDDDDDDSDSDAEEYHDHDDSNDEDFVVTSPIKVQPTSRPCRSTRTRVDRRNSSTDDVSEVLESIVDSGESETVAQRSVSFENASACPASVGPAAAAQLCNGITEDEAEIIESIVPTIRSRRQQPVSKPERRKPSSRDHTMTNKTASAKHTSSASADVHAMNNASHGEVAEGSNGDCQQLSTKPKDTLADGAQQLMARDQIMMNSVEEVLEIDGETVLIVHDDDSDNVDDADKDDL